MKSKRFFQNSSRGSTAIELLVASSIGLGIMAITLSLTGSSKRVLGYDIVRTRVNQNLRGTIDILASDLRIAGENLGDTFPVFLLEDGGTQDSLVMRRGLLSEALSVCETIDAGTSGGGNIVVANSSTLAGCDYSSNQFVFDEFSQARTSLGIVRGFIFNVGTKQGEFFTFTGDHDTGSELHLTHNTGSFTYSYPEAASVVYLVEEHRVFLSDQRLQILENEDTDNPKTISFDIDSFEVRMVDNEDIEYLDFTAQEHWTDIKYVEVKLAASESFMGKPVSRSITARLYPRNILSH